jgi:hypothetical protein
MLKKLISLLLFIQFADYYLVNAQSLRTCTTVEHDQYLRSVDPAYAKERDEIESKATSGSSSSSIQKISNATLIIPVVVHVIYNTPDENIPDEQIVSQIDALNEDYSITNANIAEVPSVWANLVGSSHIFFSLARKDENGAATNGITRTLTTEPFFSTADRMKYDSTGGSNAWNGRYFLNIWVCHLSNGGSQDILGYAQYPSLTTSPTDGVVINYKAFGRVGNNLKAQYNLGRTATHEIGHWLNLTHIWGDDNGDCNGTDFIDDTPNQGDASYGCPTFPKISCSNGPNGNMFMNYMDYTDDKCMMLFTTDQRSRMDNAINDFRDSLQYSSSYALPVSSLATDIKIAAIDSPSGVVCNKKMIPGITLQNPGMNTITSFSLEYSIDEDSLLHYEWSGTFVPSSQVKITLPEMLISEDLHTFIAKVTSVNGGADDYSLDNFKTQSFLYAPDKYNCPVYPVIPEITVLPNPASESINIETKYKDNGQPVTLTIYNVLGKNMYSANYLNSHGEIVNVYVNGLANGIYFVEVKTFNEQVSKKFVVNHQ